MSGGGVGLNGQIPKVYMKLCNKVLSLKRDENNNNNRIGSTSHESSYSMQEENSLFSSRLSIDNSLVLTPPESFSTRVGKEYEGE